MEPILDLVAVVYNAPDETEVFLSSLNNVDVPFTCTLIDNNSPDPRILALLIDWQSQKKPENLVSYRVLFNEENQGYALGCNRAAQIGTAKYLALLNCDIQFLESTTSSIVNAFENPQNKDVAVIGPLTYSETGEVTHGGIFANERGGGSHRGWMQNIENIGSLLRDEQNVPTVSGATYFVRRSVWDELTNCPTYQKSAEGALGAFLPTPHYFEETFCSVHAAKHGYRILYYGKAEMIHSWHKSSPVGGHGDQQFEVSREIFRKACEDHDITETLL